jgi:hypothetical protein
MSLKIFILMFGIIVISGCMERKSVTININEGDSTFPITIQCVKSAENVYVSDESGFVSEYNLKSNTIKVSLQFFERETIYIPGVYNKIKSITEDCVKEFDPHHIFL